MMVEAIGLSNFTTEQIKEVLAAYEVKTSILQTEVHPYSKEAELKDFLQKEGTVIHAWYPRGHGDKTLLEEPIFAKLAEKYGKSDVQIILCWHIQAGNAEKISGNNQKVKTDDIARLLRRSRFLYNKVTVIQY